jgi:hypothetical protein
MVQLTLYDQPPKIGIKDSPVVVPKPPKADPTEPKVARIRKPKVKPWMLFCLKCGWKGEWSETKEIDKRLHCPKCNEPGHLYTEEEKKEGQFSEQTEKARRKRR